MGDPDGCKLVFKVIPGAKKDEIIGKTPDGMIKVKITAPPVEGKANLHLIKFLAKRTGVKTSHIEITSGETTHIKTVHFSSEPIENILSNLLGSKH